MRLTLVPAIEKIPALVYFAESHVGKIVVVALYSALLFVIPGTPIIKEMIPVFFIAVTLLPTLRKPIIFIGGLLCVDTAVHYLAGVFFPLRELVGFNRQFLNFLRTVAVLVPILALTYYPMTGFFKKRSHWVAGFVVLALATAATLLPIPFSRFAWILAIVWAPLIWNLGVLTWEGSNPRNLNFGNRLIFLLPAWGIGHFFPIPASPGQLDQKGAGTEREFTISQLKGLKLAYWVLLLFIFQDVINWLAFQTTPKIITLDWLPTLQLPNLDNEDLGPILAGTVPSWKLWASLVIRSWFYMAYVAATSGVIISFIRMCGYSVFRHTYRPFDASDFFDFMRRMAYYYVQFIAKFFFYPTFFRLSFASRRWRVFIAMWVAIVSGGLAVRFFEVLPRVPTEGLKMVADYNFKFIVYYLTLAIFLSLSVAIKRRTAHTSSPHSLLSWRGLLGRAKIVFIYSIMTSTLIGWSKAVHTTDEYFTLFLMLIGLW